VRKLLALLIFAVIFTHAQPKFHQLLHPIFRPLLFEINTFPGDSLINFYFSYRIPYNRVVFVKSGNRYEASVKINLELIDSVKNEITRQFEEKKIHVDNFDLTNQNEVYVQGLIGLKIPDGDYKILTFFTDNNINKEFDLHPLYRRLKISKKNFLRPVIVDNKQAECSNVKKYSLTNYDGDIPFSESEYEIIIPSKDTAEKSIVLTMINNDDTVYNQLVTESFIDKNSFNECDGKILFDNKGSNYFRNFIIKDFSRKLNEGELKFEIKTNEKSHKTEKFVKKVTWLNKPFPLLNPEFAIKALKYVEGDSVIDNLLSYKDSELYKKLFDYWKKYDPTPATAYNPLMNEYYTRIDYATKEFASIGSWNGANSDRGKVYIKFGKPQEVERASDESGRVVETWIYAKLNKKFIFVDKEGKGEFILVSG